VDLLPNIASGDLARSSLAEVVAAGFRANATGTIAIEQGAGESRVYLRYGIPCGTLLFIGARLFSDYLISQRLLDPDKLPQYLKIAQRKKLRLGEVLVAEGVIPAERLPALINAHHRESLTRLCLLREGKYELRGWERPPDWTDPVRLDAFYSVTNALASDELFDRRQGILATVSRRELHVSDDIDELMERLSLTPADRTALSRLRTRPLTVPAFQALLRRADSEAIVAAQILLGLIVPGDVELPLDQLLDAEEVTITDDEAMAMLSNPIELSIPQSIAPRPRGSFSGAIPLGSGAGTPSPMPVGAPRAANRQILDDIASSVGEMFLEDGSPLSLARNIPISSSDDLALAAAREISLSNEQVVDDDLLREELVQEEPVEDAPATILGQGGPGPDSIPSESLVAGRSLLVPEEAPQSSAPHHPSPEDLPELSGAVELVADDSGTADSPDAVELVADDSGTADSLDVPLRPEPLDMSDFTLPPMDALPPLDALSDSVPASPAPVSNPSASVPAAPPESPEEAERRAVASAEVRRRMLQRAFRNVAPPQERDEGRSGVRAADPTPKRPADADGELEREIQTRLTKSVGQDHFARLDLTRSATTEQVKDAFHGFVKRFHPDRLSAQGQVHLLPLARELFARMHESYGVLLEPATRARYLTELESASQPQKLTPKEARVAYDRAVIYIRKKDFRLAETQLRRAIEADPLPEYSAELAWTLLSNPERRDGAREEIKTLIVKAVKPKPDSDRVYVVAAHVARIEGDLNNEEKFFRAALDRNPKNIEARQHLNLIERRRGKKR
jgi:hypothetical protein